MRKDIIPGRLWRAIGAIRSFAGDERLWACNERLSATGNMRHVIILLTRLQVFICEYSNGDERLRAALFEFMAPFERALRMPVSASVPHTHTSQRVGVH